MFHCSFILCCRGLATLFSKRLGAVMFHCSFVVCCRGPFIPLRQLPSAINQEKIRVARIFTRDCHSELDHDGRRTWRA